MMKPPIHFTILHQLLTISTTPKQLLPPRAPAYQNPHPYKPVQASTYQNHPHITPRARQSLEIRNTRNYAKLDELLAQLFERMKEAVVGHDTEDFYGLKNRVEALTKEGSIQLTGARPNVNNKPLPNNRNADVNMITTEDNWNLKRAIIPIGKMKKVISLVFASLMITVEAHASTEVTVISTKTPTIWGAKPEEALKNLTCTPSLVCREYTKIEQVV
ncbi:hypothetical protein HAX54_006683 [Datura stramonium]|uniref:Uncharacterized protein n=1 Tax=Datura stramonium TaxID=4076 RepID=A0ABS8WXC1_DATST|nr:hypothetical protein [Datura stramonium]